MENNKQNQTEVKNFYGGIYFDRCQLTDVTFQTLVQGDMRMRPDEEKEGEKGEEAEAVKEEASAASAPLPEPVYTLCRSVAGSPRRCRTAGRGLATALPDRRRKGRTGLAAGRPAEHRHSLANLRPLVGREARNPALGLQQGDGAAPHRGVHAAGGGGDGGGCVKALLL